MLSHKDETMKLKAFVATLGVDMVGIAALAPIEGLPIGLGKASSDFLGKY